MPSVNALSSEPSISALHCQDLAGESLREVAYTVLAATFARFDANLNLLRTSNLPEVVHQTRIDWRRFKSALRLFKPVLAKKRIPATVALQPMLKSLGRLRDLEVARYQTLPTLVDQIIRKYPTRAQEWARVTQTFARADRRQRKILRAALLEPEVGLALANVSRWVKELSDGSALFSKHSARTNDLRSWAKHRLAEIHNKLLLEHRAAATPENQHHLRIIAKTLRYSIEMLDPALPEKRAKDWYCEAIKIQSSIGKERDLLRAVSLAEELRLPADQMEILRGLATNKRDR